MKETYGLITYFLECAGDDAAKLETFVKLLLTYTKKVKDAGNPVRKKTLSAVILHLTPFHEELDQLLCDEDLTDEKLREASEGLLPRLADAIRRIHQLKPADPDLEKSLQQQLTR